jgi:putative flavoprotein involved in K+ transport
MGGITHRQTPAKWRVSPKSGAARSRKDRLMSQRDDAGEEAVMTIHRARFDHPAQGLIEEGAAFTALSARPLTKPAPRPRERERFDVIVIGGGQAGLSVGYQLARRGLSFVILDAHARIGDSWRKRWDSLRLFTPARFDGLEGMPFPAPPDSFPTKDEMADYLEEYAAHFELPVRTGVRVDRLTREQGRYVVHAGEARLEADQVVVAMANYQAPRVPDFARELAPDIVQLHSSEYRSPAQLRAGDVLIVGAGNSGSEIALELAKHQRVMMSGRDTGHIPFRIGGFWGRLLLVRLVLRFVFHRLLTVETAFGRRVRAKMLSQGGPLIRVKPSDLLAAGVERAPRVLGVRDGLPLLEDGRLLQIANVIWCTGFEPGLSWIDLPIFDQHGEPSHERGLTADQPGLYFVGRMFLYAASSVMIHGVGRDAARIAAAVALRSNADRAAGRAEPALAAE